MKPVSCLDEKCKGEYDTCPMCINRSIIAKEGYALIQAIEVCGASELLTNAVNRAEAFVKLAEKEISGLLETRLS